jgi:hypothetical protein
LAFGFWPLASSVVGGWWLGDGGLKNEMALVQEALALVPRSEVKNNMPPTELNEEKIYRKLVGCYCVEYAGDLFGGFVLEAGFDELVLVDVGVG